MTQPDLTAIIFRALYKGYDLVTIGGTYIVYPPRATGGPLLYIGDSLGAIARQIADLENPPDLGDLLLWEDALPRRHRHPH